MLCVDVLEEKTVSYHLCFDIYLFPEHYIFVLRFKSQLLVEFVRV